MSGYLAHATTSCMTTTMDENGRAQEIWLGLWDIVRDEDPSVPLAMPWRTMGIDADLDLQRQDPDYAMPGRQMVTWVGFRPSTGMVYGTSLWHPEAEARAPLPHEWNACDIELFRTRVHGIGKEDRRGPYSFRKLPMPWWLQDEGLSWSTTRHTMDEGQNMPFLHFVEALGIPRRVFGLVDSSRGDPDEALRYVTMSRSVMTMAAVMWCVGSRRAVPSRVTVEERDPVTGRTRLVCRDDPLAEEIPAPLTRERRTQAILSMPCFATALVTPDITYDVIDHGRELVPALADRLEIQPSTVRILARAGASSDGETLSAMRSALDSRSTLTMLDAVPRSTLRDMATGLSAGGWSGLIELAIEFDYSMPPEIVRHVGRGLRRDRDMGWDWLATEGNRWQHARDVTEAMSRDLMWPAEALADPAVEATEERTNFGNKLATLALGSLGVTRAGRILDGHMAGTLRRARELQALGKGGPAEWPIPAEPVTARTGRVIRFLSSSWELAREGDVMDNCVGDYGDACASGRCAIMSIGAWKEGEEGEGAWQPSSTVELRRGGEDDGIVVIQHRGWGNGQPPPEDAALVREWLAGLETGETLFDERVLPPTATLSHISLALGEGWDTPEAAAMRWDHWRRVLDVRHRSAGEFLAAAVGTVGLDPDIPDMNTQGMLALLETVKAHERAMAAMVQAGPSPALPAP